MKADEKVPLFKISHPERGLSLRKYLHLQGSSVSSFIAFSLWGESPHFPQVSSDITLRIVRRPYLGLRSILTGSGDRPSPELPLCISSFWPVTQPHAQPALLNTAASSAYSSQRRCEEWKSREGETSKAPWGILVRTTLLCRWRLLCEMVIGSN